MYDEILICYTFGSSTDIGNGYMDPGVYLSVLSHSLRLHICEAQIESPILSPVAQESSLSSMKTSFQLYLHW